MFLHITQSTAKLRSLSQFRLPLATTSLVAAGLCAVAGCTAISTGMQAPSIQSTRMQSQSVGTQSTKGQAIHLEAEDGQLTGTKIDTSRPGFSGRGYVTNFVKDGDKVVLHTQSPGGFYTVKIRYCAPQEKGFDLVVNGAKMSGMFQATPTFAEQSIGQVELKMGDNEIAIEKSWGYYDIDAVDLVPATIDMSLKKPPATLVDSKASPRTRALFASLLRLYGEKTVSGQTGAPDIAYINTTTGKFPAIVGGDLIEYSPTRMSHGSKPDPTTEQMIDIAKSGSVLTVMWHWNAPSEVLDAPYKDAQGKIVDAHWWSAFYTSSTTFDLQKAMDDPNSAEYKALIHDMDAIAVQLKKLDAANIPILWRPLHEAEGGWFWWGAKGPEPFKKLWKLMFNRFTNVYKLHNLIWVYSSGTKLEWYPGDQYVDIVGIDQYPSDWSDPLNIVWNTLKTRFDGRKMLALTEMGGAPDVDKMRRYGVRWSYFMSWQNDLGPRKLPPADLKRIYSSPRVITKDELGNIVTWRAQP